METIGTEYRVTFETNGVELSTEPTPNKEQAEYALTRLRLSCNNVKLQECTVSRSIWRNA